MHETAQKMTLEAPYECRGTTWNLDDFNPASINGWDGDLNYKQDAANTNGKATFREIRLLDTHS